MSPIPCSQPPGFFTVLRWPYANAATYTPVWEQASQMPLPWKHVSSFLFCFQACWVNLFFSFCFKNFFCVFFLLIDIFPLFYPLHFFKTRYKLFSRFCDYCYISYLKLRRGRACADFFLVVCFAYLKKSTSIFFSFVFSSPHLPTSENWKHERPCLSIGLRARKSLLFPWLIVCVLGQSVTITDKSCA